MDLDLAGKVAIVTGGSGGIGRAIAYELAREGASVAIVARGRAALQAVADELRTATQAAVLPVVADTANDRSVQAMVEAVVGELGGVDVLVNCASGVGSHVAFRLPQVSGPVFWGEMNVKVLGYLHCIQHVAPHMIQRGWGRIINISGMAARQPLSIVGSVRNVAVVALAKNAADELGPHGINVTVVHPGATLTPHYAVVAAEWASAHGVTREEGIRRRYATNLIRKPIEPRDIANVVAFLAPPRSVAINGDVIGVAGGVPGEIRY